MTIQNQGQLRVAEALRAEAQNTRMEQIKVLFGMVSSKNLDVPWPANENEQISSRDMS